MLPGRRDNCMTSGAWARATPHFLDVINLLPGMETEDYHFDLMNNLGVADSDNEHGCHVHSRGLVDGICDACRRANNPASMRATFHGRPYDLPWFARSWYASVSSEKGITNWWTGSGSECARIHVRPCTMRFRSATKVLAKRVLKYHRISRCLVECCTSMLFHF